MTSSGQRFRRLLPRWADGWTTFLGGLDGLLIALLVFVILDYLTGVMRAIAEHKLSSAIGFKGICRKVEPVNKSL